MKNTYEETALIVAAKYGEPASIKILKINGSANIEAKDRNGNTALILATFSANFESCIMLLDLGANVNAKNDANRTALAEAKIA